MTSILALLLAGMLAGCEDPTRDEAAAELGPEAPGVATGPLHRPGQPCLTCHDGATARAYSLAGTVFWTADSELPAPGTRVHVIDQASRRFDAVTNCAGNFFIAPEDFIPELPLWVMLSNGDEIIEMDSPVHVDGSCAGCHGLEASPSSAGRVYLHGLPPASGPGDCP